MLLALIFLFWLTITTVILISTDPKNQTRSCLNRIGKLLLIASETLILTIITATIAYIFNFWIGLIGAVLVWLNDLAANMQGKTPPLSAVSAWLASLISKALRINPGPALSHNLYQPVSTFGDTGIATSWTRSQTNEFRLVSTVYHPNGCYQIAVFDKPISDLILGYKLASDMRSATAEHVKVVISLLNSDPPNWEEWNTNSDDALQILKDLVATEPCDEMLLNKLLVEAGFQPAKRR
jgi:hypothetical protein